jgi:DNA-binding transcriptional LysR family regulator
MFYRASSPIAGKISNILNLAFFEILRDNGIEPRIAQEASQSIGVAILVADALGVALVPASITNLRLPGLIYRPIEGRSRTTPCPWYGSEPAELQPSGLFSMWLELNIPRASVLFHKIMPDR